MIKRIKNFFRGSEPISIYTKDILRSPNHSIGDFTYGNPAVLDYMDGTRLTIGRYCSIASGVTIILGGNHRTDWISTYPFNILSEHFPAAKGITGHPVSKGNVIIGHDVWIGTNATILSGVSIGNGAVIAAEAVVTKDVRPFEIVAGNPARHIRFRFTEEEIRLIESVAWWNWSEELINKKIHEICSSNVRQFMSNIKNEEDRWKGQS